jgi:lysophospholipase L1-like esterase
MTFTGRGVVAALVLVLALLAAGGLWWVAGGTSRGRAAAAPGVYVALGASDAVGVGAQRPAQEGWAPRVHAGLPAGTQLVNVGVSGATLRDVIERQLPVALDARPRWATLWPGVNDLRAGVDEAAFGRDLDLVLGELDRIEGITVVVLNIPDLRLLPVFGGGSAARLDATVQRRNALIAAAADRHGALVVDLYAGQLELAQHPEYISADGFHPSSAGYARIADLVLERLRAGQSSVVSRQSSGTVGEPVLTGWRRGAAAGV